MIINYYDCFKFSNGQKQHFKKMILCKLLLMDLKGPENYDRLLLIIENKYPKFVLKYCRF